MRKAGERVATTTSSTHVETIPDPTFSARGVPSCSWPGHWLTIQEFSGLMGRQPSTVYGWLANGTFKDFGLSVYELRLGRKHSARFFVRNPYC
jgi:hypothetical protein